MKGLSICCLLSTNDGMLYAQMYRYCRVLEMLMRESQATDNLWILNFTEN